MIVIHSQKEIEKMRCVGKLAAQLLDEIGLIIRPGLSTEEINTYGVEYAAKHNVVMAPYNYVASRDCPPFPKHLCTSINNVVCHGIPKSTECLKKGDIINVDVTLIKDGYHGDTSRTFTVGKVSAGIQKLVEVTEKALYVGIEQMQPGSCISQIGLAITNFINPYKYGIVEELTGHGIGRRFHQEPSVFHFYNPKYRLPLKPGMIMTCEPMINMGTKHVTVLDDQWTVVTADGEWSAQFEHTVVITEDGPEILTKL
ncbi:type I methionyl aminopeptidase [Candidatus Parcubacteria bacterium]|nr:MAG: type I methionyl aminopeptidase [Candidatus Parcubacteria bacterium]